MATHAERPARPTVHLVAGLPAAGKTTYARQLEATRPAVRFTLDEWMLRLHGLRFDAPEYAELAEECKGLIWDTALQVLRTGVDVVLDWNQWSRQRRAGWSDKARTAGFEVMLHYLLVPADIASTRADNRRAQYTHEIDSAGVAHMQSIFERPSAAEGIPLHVINGAGD